MFTETLARAQLCDYLIACAVIEHYWELARKSLISAMAASDGPVPFFFLNSLCCVRERSDSKLLNLYSVNSRWDADLTETSPADKEVKVQVRFRIEPFDIGIESNSMESEAGVTIVSLINVLQAIREQIILAISSMDTSKLNRKMRPVPEEADSLEKVAARLNVDSGELAKMFYIARKRLYHE